jgi:hypothetical protein
MSRNARKPTLRSLTSSGPTRLPAQPSAGLLKSLSRRLLERLQAPRAFYENRIVNNMENLYRVIRKGDVLLVEGRSEMSRIIQVLTQSSWSHLAFYVGDTLQRDLSDGTNTRQGNARATTEHMLVEADTVSGVVAVPLDKYRDNNIRICRPFGILPEDLETVIADVIGNLGKHYDHQNIVDLALLALPQRLNPFKKRTIKACLGGCTEYKVICSGMIAKAFQKVGYPIVPALAPDTTTEGFHRSNPYGSGVSMRHYSQIVPRDFDLSPNFEIVKYNIIGMGAFDYKSIWVHPHPTITP